MQSIPEWATVVSSHQIYSEHHPYRVGVQGKQILYDQEYFPPRLRHSSIDRRDWKSVSVFGKEVVVSLKEWEGRLIVDEFLYYFNDYSK